jgi:ribonuclease BN (tRNA processing enzyme)
MKLTFLGSGDAFVNDPAVNYQSNMVIEQEGVRLLFDAGGDLKFSLREAGLRPADVNTIYVSHLHADHVGGLEYLALTKKFSKRPADKRKQELYASADVLGSIWSGSLVNELRTLQGEIATLETFFIPKPVKKNGTFTMAFPQEKNLDYVKFQLIQMIHVINDFSFMPSYGLQFDSPGGKSVFITSDTQMAPNQMMDFYQKADIIFQDCETSDSKSGVHAHYLELLDLPQEVKGKMWLYHGQRCTHDTLRDGFRGFVEKGQTFDL